MLQPPAAFKDRYRVWLVSDDLAFLRIGSDGKLRAVNPEYGFFGVVPGTNQETNPSAMEAFGPNTGTIFTNVAVKLGVDAQGRTVVVDSWWEGKGPKPTDLEGWVDWKLKPLKDRTPEEADQPWAQGNSRATSRIENVSNWIGHAAKLPEAERPTDWNNPEGVPISITFWGGRLDSREPLIRQLRDAASGVYDGVVMGAQTTAAQSGAAVGEIRKFRRNGPSRLAARELHAHALVVAQQPHAGKRRCLRVEPLIQACRNEVRVDVDDKIVHGENSAAWSG